MKKHSIKNGLFAWIVGGLCLLAAPGAVKARTALNTHAMSGKQAAIERLHTAMIDRANTVTYDVHTVGPALKNLVKEIGRKQALGEATSKMIRILQEKDSDLSPRKGDLPTRPLIGGFDKNGSIVLHFQGNNLVPLTAYQHKDVFFDPHFMNALFVGNPQNRKVMLQNIGKMFEEYDLWDGNKFIARIGDINFDENGQAIAKPLFKRGMSFVPSETTPTIPIAGLKLDWRDDVTTHTKLWDMIQKGIKPGDENRPVTPAENTLIDELPN